MCVTASLFCKSDATKMTWRNSYKFELSFSREYPGSDATIADLVNGLKSHSPYPFTSIKPYPPPSSEYNISEGGASSFFKTSLTTWTTFLTKSDVKFGVNVWSLDSNTCLLSQTAMECIERRHSESFNKTNSCHTSLIEWRIERSSTDESHNGWKD